MRDLLLFWIQGAWKGTQSALLQKKFPKSFSYFSTGDVFRALMSNDNAIGNHLKERMEKGDLIDDEVTNSLFKTYFYTVVHDHKYMLLDGFPRTIPQMIEMIKLIKRHERDLVGVHLVLPDQVAIDRMKERGREDDSHESINHRISQFYAKTQPTIDWFANNAQIIKVDANRPIEEVEADLEAIAMVK